MQVINQKPQVISPLVTTSISGDFNPQEHLSKMVIEPLFTPLSKAGQVQISDNSNNITQDAASIIIGNCLSSNVDINFERTAKALLSKTLMYFPQNTKLLINDIFAIQSATKAGIDEPDTDVLFTVDGDVVAPAKEFLVGNIDYDEWFACLAFYTRADTLGFAFVSETAFNAFKTWFENEINQITSLLSPNTIRIIDNFKKSCSLSGLTESMWLRKSANDGNEEYSFARILVNMLTRYARDVAPDEVWICPFSLDRLLIPESLVFINIEAHAKSKPRQIKQEWDLINDAIAEDLRILKPGQVQKLTAATRAAKKIAKAMGAANQKDGTAARAANVRFRKTPPTATDIVKLVSKVLNKLAYVNHSQNIYKDVKMSFARPNRRDPDDFNKQGKVVSTKYRPDIHLYVDTSGSITESQYQDAVKACITLARKLNVNLYFNSFSHVMTTSVMLPTKGRTSKQIWKQIQNTPKVTGGTDYAQIWRYIDSSKRRKRELSLIITDFEYWPPSHHVTHPKNIYYLPISNISWSDLVAEASRFSNSMGHIFPQIRSHILI